MSAKSAKSGSKKIQKPRCRICRRTVSPDKDVAFGVGTKALFYTHKGECEDAVNSATDTLGKFTRILLETKQPGLAKQISSTIDKFQRVARILSE